MKIFKILSFITIFSLFTGCSHSAYNQERCQKLREANVIQLGMTKERVMSLFGEPLFIMCCVDPKTSEVHATMMYDGVSFRFTDDTLTEIEYN